MAGLQAHFQKDWFDPVDFFQEIKDRCRKTVRPGSDGDGGNLFWCDGFLIESPESIHRSVSVGKRLKIGDISAAGILFAALAFSTGNLPGDRKPGTLCVVSASAFTAENAAALR